MEEGVDCSLGRHTACAQEQGLAIPGFRIYPALENRFSQAEHTWGLVRRLPCRGAPHGAHRPAVSCCTARL